MTVEQTPKVGVERVTVLGFRDILGEDGCKVLVVQDRFGREAWYPISYRRRFKIGQSIKVIPVVKSYPSGSSLTTFKLSR